MSIENLVAVDDGPVGDDIIDSQILGIHGLANDQVAGQQIGVHRIGLNGENADTENAGGAAAGGGHIGHIGTQRCQDNGDHQDHIDHGIEDALASAFFLLHNLLLLCFIGDNSFFLHLLHGIDSLPFLFSSFFFI